ncbi:hypothetical protein F4Z99_20260 [Candidatus Poribacteria bacterium]|nr:hypothetical protein [Candidatus Poribacteria bacterium]MYA99327.1 hypothetical protein [Candidatus Poribacteria bacterium]
MPFPIIPEAKEKVTKICIKYLEAEEIAITGSENVSDNAIYTAQKIILTITSKRPEIRRELSDFTCILVARGENVASYLDLDENDPNYNHGCTLYPDKNNEFPGYLASVVEWENQPDMGVFLHELAHAIMYAIRQLSPNFYSALEQSYNTSIASKTWDRNPRSSQNVEEYWAEGVRMWYYIGEFESREAFKEYDQGLTSLIDDWLSADEIPKTY